MGTDNPPASLLSSSDITECIRDSDVTTVEESLQVLVEDLLFSHSGQVNCILAALPHFTEPVKFFELLALTSTQNKDVSLGLRIPNILKSTISLWPRPEDDSFLSISSFIEQIGEQNQGITCMLQKLIHEKWNETLLSSPKSDSGGSPRPSILHRSTSSVPNPKHQFHETKRSSSSSSLLSSPKKSTPTGSPRSQRLNELKEEKREEWNCSKQISNGFKAPLLSIAPTTLAEQLHLLDQKHLSSIPLNEFHQTRWTKPKECPFITKIATFSNNLVYRFAYELIHSPKEFLVLLTNLTKLSNVIHSL